MPASIWNLTQEFGATTVFRYDQTGNIQTSFAPGSDWPGTAYNSATGCIWIGNDSGDEWKQFTPAGSFVSQFAASVNYDGAFDPDGSLWAVDRFDTDLALYSPSTGTLQKSFTTPDGSPKGIAVEDTQSLWVVDQLSIYKINQSGSVQSQLVTPTNGAGGIGIESGNSLWHSDVNNSVYEIQRDGTVLTQFAASTDVVTGTTTTDEPLQPAAPSLGAVLKTSTAVLTADSNAVIQTQQ